MTFRFLLYPLVLLVALQLAPLLRARPRGWHLGPILQLVIVLVVSLAALAFFENAVAVGVAWALYGWVVIAPALLARVGNTRVWQARWRSAARSWRRLAFLSWGPLRRLYREHARALEMLAAGRGEEAVARLDALAAEPMPEPIRGMVQLWKLTTLHVLRDWSGLILAYQRMDHWGSLASATQGRLLVARALAETGCVEDSLRQLQFVALSPRTLGPLHERLSMTRISVAALAGDREELEKLLGSEDGQARRLCSEEQRSRRRGWAGFAAYWRGRCALACGDRVEAGRQLARAEALTPARQVQWHEIVRHYRQQAESAEPLPEPVPLSDAYRWGQQLLRMADAQTEPWRRLMLFGRPPPATGVLLVGLALLFLLTGVVLSPDLQEQIFERAGNSRATVAAGEWWRLFSALFLHAGLLHLLMNAGALWIFGSAIERTGGGGRALLIFFGAGAAGNLVSAALAQHDLAVGASGGIFGLVGAFAVAVYRLRGPLYAEIRRRLLMMLGMLVSVDFLIGGLEPMVDDLAHVAGFLAGVALALLVGRRVDRATIRAAGG